MDDARVISNYKLIRQIGIGGMGVVYLGQHTVIDRRVAIKLLRPEFSNNEDLVRRFFNEARAAATSRHPGIVEIVDVGFDQGQAFITMEFIEGETLSKYVRSRGRLSQAEAVAFTAQVASALQVAHNQTIVHRDLKPSNIMVTLDPRSGETITKVFDFGIAKLFDENSSHTRTGVVIGTPLYMSPEQCKGAGEVDHRSDLYSLGCILYFMLTGKRVFSGKGDGEIIAQHIFIEAPSPALLTPLCDSLCALVLKLLAKDPGDRFQSTEELVAALGTVSGDLAAEIEPTSVVMPAVPIGMPLAAPSNGSPNGTSPGTGSSVTATPAQIIYPSPLDVPEVAPPPTLMRRLARQGRWIAAGFAIAVFVTVGILSSESPAEPDEAQFNVAGDVAEREGKSVESGISESSTADGGTADAGSTAVKQVVEVKQPAVADANAQAPIDGTGENKGTETSRNEDGRDPNGKSLTKKSSSDTSQSSATKSGSKKSGKKSFSKKSGKKSGSKDSGKNNSESQNSDSGKSDGKQPKTLNPFEK